MLLRQVREHERGEADAGRAGRSAEPCDEASSAQLRSPASSISRNSRWRSIASGVVRTAGRALAADPALDGADQPGPSPGRLEDRVEQERGRRLAVRAGDARDLELARRLAEERRPRPTAIAARASRPRAAARPASTGRSTTSATAPRSTAVGAKSWPSARAPGTQKKSAPGATRARVVREVAISTGVAGVADDRLRCERRRSRRSRLHCRRQRYRECRRPPSRQRRGGISRYWSAKRAISWKAGAATTPPQIAPRGSSTVTRTTSRGLLRRDEADERGDVARVGVAARAPACAAVPVLPATRVARDRGERAGPALARRRRPAASPSPARDRCCETIRRRFGRGRAARRRPARRGAAAPRRRRSRSRRRRRHLERRDRDALADRDVADRRARPLLDGSTIPRVSPGNSMPGLLAEAEAVDPAREPRPAEHLRDRDRADVRRLREDLRDRHPLRSARSCASWIIAVGDLDRRYGSVNGVVGATTLSSSAAAIVTILNVEPGSYVSVTARLRLQVGATTAPKRFASKPGAFAIARIAPVRGSSTIAVAALRAPARDRRRARTASAFAWSVWSSVRTTSSPGALRAATRRRRSRGRPGRGRRLVARAAARATGRAALEPVEAAVVDAREAEHLRGDRALRVGAALLRVEAEARAAQLLELRRLRGSALRCDEDEALRAVGERRVELVGVEAERLRRPRAPTRRGSTTWRGSA